MLKLAIYSKSLNLSGASISLINLLNQIDYDNINVDLFVEYFDSPLLLQVPKNVNIINPPRYRDIFNSSVLALPSLKNLFKYCSHKKAQKNSCFHTFDYYYHTVRRMPMVAKKYDIAISYRNRDMDTFYVLNNIKAKQKYCWIHGETFKGDSENFLYQKLYNQYTKMVAVSKTAKDSFLETYPGLIDKVEIFYNIIDFEKINKESYKYLPKFKTDKLHILSVGRLVNEKNFTLAIESAKKLRDRGIKFEWFIIGDGEKRKDLEKLISEFALQKYVYLLGSLDNPYPYFRYSDIYVQTSLSESNCLTIAEARFFNLPIVSTNIPAASEQIKHGYSGLLSEIDPESITENILEIINDNGLREDLIRNLKKEKNAEY